MNSTDTLIIFSVYGFAAAIFYWFYRATFSSEREQYSKKRKHHHINVNSNSDRNRMSRDEWFSFKATLDAANLVDSVIPPNDNELYCDIIPDYEFVNGELVATRSFNPMRAEATHVNRDTPDNVLREDFLANQAFTKHNLNVVSNDTSGNHSIDARRYVADPVTNNMFPVKDDVNNVSKTDIIEGFLANQLLSGYNFGADTEAVKVREAMQKEMREQHTATKFSDLVINDLHARIRSLENIISSANNQPELTGEQLTQQLVDRVNKVDLRLLGETVIHAVINKNETDLISMAQDFITSEKFKTISAKLSALLDGENSAETRADNSANEELADNAEDWTRNNSTELVYDSSDFTESKIFNQ